MFARRFPLIGLLLTWIALASQMVAATVVPPVLSALTLDDIPLCHTNSGADPTNPPPIHHTTDCLLCPLCVSLLTPWALPAMPPSVAPPREAGPISRAGLPPPATAPPRKAWSPTLPRPPPIQA
jgi:hypothetical protein